MFTNIGTDPDVPEEINNLRINMHEIIEVVREMGAEAEKLATYELTDAKLAKLKKYYPRCEGLVMDIYESVDKVRSEMQDMKDIMERKDEN